MVSFSVNLFACILLKFFRFTLTCYSTRLAWMAVVAIETNSADKIHDNWNLVLTELEEYWRTCLLIESWISLHVLGYFARNKFFMWSCCTILIYLKFLSCFILLITSPLLFPGREGFAMISCHIWCVVAVRWFKNGEKWRFVGLMVCYVNTRYFCQHIHA